MKRLVSWLAATLVAIAACGSSPPTHFAELSVAALSTWPTRGSLAQDARSTASALSAFNRRAPEQIRFDHVRLLFDGVVPGGVIAAVYSWGAGKSAVAWLGGPPLAGHSDLPRLGLLAYALQLDAAHASAPPVLGYVTGTVDGPNPAVVLAAPGIASMSLSTSRPDRTLETSTTGLIVTEVSVSDIRARLTAHVVAGGATESRLLAGGVFHPRYFPVPTGANAELAYASLQPGSAR